MAALVSGRVWVIANFKETQMPGVAVGSAAQVSVDAIPDRLFSGRVESVSPASGSQFALLPPDNATGNFTRIAQRIPVRIALDIGQPGMQLIRPGMSSVVKVGSNRPASTVSRTMPQGPGVSPVYPSTWAQKPATNSRSRRSMPASARIEAAGLAPTARGEELTVADFLAIARA